MWLVFGRPARLPDASRLQIHGVAASRHRHITAHPRGLKVGAHRVIGLPGGSGIRYIASRPAESPMTDDTILITDLLVRGIIGVNEWEREQPQDILVNVAMRADTRAAAQADDVDRSVNYRTVAKSIIRHVEDSRRLTLEALADDIARLCLAVEMVQEVSVRVEKPGAVRFARSVGVEIRRRREDLA